MLHLVASVIMIQCMAAGATPVMPLSLEEGWREQLQGPWRMRHDHRGLLAMRHLWAPSQKGGRAVILRELTIPPDWQGPVSLTFYCSDDYHMEALPENPDPLQPVPATPGKGFRGYRCKQVLVDNQVVWSQDVADPVEPGASPRFRIALPVKPGEKCLLALAAYDVKGTAPEDASDGDGQGQDNADAAASTAPPTDPQAAFFQTHVYWGDVYLVDGDTEPPVGRRPVEAKVAEVHNRRWPLPPFGDAWTGDFVPLTISAPVGLPKRGFPVQWGVPFPVGRVKEPGQVNLTIPGAGKGRKATRVPVSIQRAALDWWPDDSVRWMLLDFIAKPGMATVNAAFAGGRVLPNGVKVTEGDQAITLDTGVMRWEARPGNAIGAVTQGAAIRLDGVGLSLTVNGQEILGTAEASSVVEDGPVRCTVRSRGRFEGLANSAGAFHLYVSSYAGLPYLKLMYRWFNDTPAPVALGGMKVVLTLHEPPKNLRVPEWPVQDGVVLRQVSEGERVLDGTPVDPKLPVFVAWDGGAATVKHFRELYPKSISVEGIRVILDLAAAGESPIAFTPGEAKTHEIWLSFGEDNPEAFAAAVEHPPILENAEYYCATGAFGRARPHAGVPVLHDHMTADFGNKDWEDFGQAFGLRDFPDSPYYGGLPNWSNNYYERMLNLLSEWVLSGDRAWADRALEVCEHIMDVAVIHSEIPGHADWIGALHGPGNNHVAEPWPPNLRVDGLSLYHKLTGNPEARDAFLGVADYCVRTHAGVDAPSARHQAGPFEAIYTAYSETGEITYLEEGAARVESVLRAMDLRRGVWPCEHGSPVYRGNVPWMNAQLARPLYLWYYATGDIQAAQALTALAESVICENTDWDQPGAMAGYSHNPAFAMTATYDPLILPMLFAAYEFTEDPFFLDAAKAQWTRWTAAKTFDSPLNCYWNTPWLVWCLNHYGLLDAHAAPTPTQP